MGDVVRRYDTKRRGGGEVFNSREKISNLFPFRLLEKARLRVDYERDLKILDWHCVYTVRISIYVYLYVRAAYMLARRSCARAVSSVASNKGAIKLYIKLSRDSLE